MKLTDNKRRILILTFLELCCLFIFISFLNGIWSALTPLLLQSESLSTFYEHIEFFALSLIRPFLLVPLYKFAFELGKQSSIIFDLFYLYLSGLLSFLSFFLSTQYLFSKFFHPWLKKNLPQATLFLRSQAIKISIISRLIPFMPFDLSTAILALLNFKFKEAVIITSLTIIPEIVLIYYFKINFNLISLKNSLFLAIVITI